MTDQRSRILARLESMGARPKRSLGQNFLVSEGAIERILLVARGPGNAPPPMIVEVGPGLGSLTDGLLEQGPDLVLIELDREFAAHWRARLAERGRPGEKLVEADALALDWAELALPDGALLVSNLPYQISSSLVIERSIAPCGIARMVLMFQKEVAQRLTARERTPEYGLLTAVAQPFWTIRSAVEAGPRDFYPPPKVASRVLEFRRRVDAPDVDRALYLRFVKAGFAHRRKLLARNLTHEFFRGEAGAAERIGTALAAQGFAAERTRAEELSPDAFVALFQALQAPRA